MRHILATALLIACSSSSAPSDPHALVACDQDWYQIYLGTLAPNAKCEAACQHRPAMPGNSCSIPPNDAGFSSGTCNPSVTADGVTGCCELADRTCTVDGAMDSPCEIAFVECN